ncbi:MAG TPA: hypothetical protein VKU19_40820 [Bryobacteraceae bacterium]|nr:hypothetical protein [Bryobacteraceae bacterium]
MPGVAQTLLFAASGLISTLFEVAAKSRRQPVGDLALLDATNP